MVRRRVALATQALFLILLIITPHLVLAGGGGGGKKGGGGGKKGGGGGKKPVAPYRPGPRKPVGHGGKKPAAPYKPPVSKKTASPYRPPVQSKPVGKKPAAPYKPPVSKKPAAPYRPPLQSKPVGKAPAHVVTKPTGPAGPGLKGKGEGIAYKGGPLLTGEVILSIVFYGQWLSQHKDLIMSFINSIGVRGSAVCNWWGVVEGYQGVANQGSKGIQLKVGTQQSDDNASLGKVLTKDFIKMLVQKGNSGKPNTIVVILAHKDVAVSDLCRGKCYQHGSFDGKLPYLVVGNPEVECPGVCGLPFAKASYGPPGPVLKPPNGDMGADATIINFAAGLASVVTNPFSDGFSKPGPKTWPIEAGNACENMFGKITTDPVGCAFNAVGENGRKFMLPGIWDAKACSCWTP